jgi:hypothetical protein
MKDCVFRLKLTEEEHRELKKYIGHLSAGKHDISELEFRNIYGINLMPLNERLCIPTKVN